MSGSFRFVKFLLLVIIILAGFCGALQADSVLLSVPFIPQCPPGIWSQTMNCGETSLLMGAGYTEGFSLASSGILDIDNFLGLNQNGSNGIGCAEIVSVGKSLYGLNLLSVHWSLNQVKAEVAAGRPVIVGITAGYLKTRPYGYSGAHWVLVIGFDDSKTAFKSRTKGIIYVNDPGTTKGAVFAYPTDQFEKAFNDDSARCHNGINAIYGFADSIVTKSKLTIDFSNWLITRYLDLKAVKAYFFAATKLPRDPRICFDGVDLGIPICFENDAPDRVHSGLKSPTITFPHDSPGQTSVCYQINIPLNLLIYGKNLVEVKLPNSLATKLTNEDITPVGVEFYYYDF